MADEAKADEGKTEEVKADGGKAEGGKRSHSPGGGGKVKKPRGARRGGFYGPMRGGPPGWGRPPPPFMEDYDDQDEFHHRDEWFPVYPPFPPPPPPPPPPPAVEDFADDSFAIFGSAPGGDGGRGRGRGGFGRGRGFWRGGGRGIPQFMGRGRGGPPNRGGNRGGAQASAGTAPRARGRGQVQKGLPPGILGAKPAKKSKWDQKTVTVPPVHSLAKVTLDVANMSTAEKIHRFSLFVRNDPMKDNAIQHVMNAQTASKLMAKIGYEAEELAKVGSKHMYTGSMSLDGVFLARAVCVNKKELKHLVFEKGLNVLMNKTVAEIYSLIDPGVQTLRDELEKEERAENAKKNTPSRDWMGQDIGEALQIIIHKLKTKLPTVDSDISRIEQAISVCQCVLRHQFTIDTIKLNNGRFNYAGAFEINNIVIARGKGVSKKECKRDTYGNAMKNLMEKTIEELRLPVPEEDFVEIVQTEAPESKKSKKDSDIMKKSERDKLPLKERFTEIIKAIKGQVYKDSNVGPIDVTALAYGITPMSVYRKLKTAKDNLDTISCELYLQNVFIASAEGRRRNPAQREAYNKAFELLTMTDAETLLTQHRTVDAESLKSDDVIEVSIKGGGRRSESNLAALRRNDRVEQSKSLKKDDLVIVEHSDWSNDRVRNAFCILQCSCTQNGMLLKWETEGSNGKYRCEVFIQEDKVGEASSPTKQNVRNLAMIDALFQLYETQDTVKISLRDDSKTWIPWEKIKKEAEKLEKESPKEETYKKAEEGGAFPAPNLFVVKVALKKLEKFAEKGTFEEVVFGPGIPASECREIRIGARQFNIQVDVRHYLGEPYMIFYKRMEYLDLVKLLKKTKTSYGKYQLVPKDELPNFDDVAYMFHMPASQKVDDTANGGDAKEEEMATD